MRPYGPTTSQSTAQLSIQGLVQRLAVHRKKIDISHNRSRSLTTPIIIAEEKPLGENISHKKTLLFNTARKKEPGVTKKSKFLLQAPEETERLECLFTLNLNQIIVAEAL